MRGMSEDERQLLTHIMMWGSDGYPIKKVGSHHWVWGPVNSIQGPPVVFHTRKAAVESFEKFVDVLIDAAGELAQARAIAERAVQS